MYTHLRQALLRIFGTPELILTQMNPQGNRPVHQVPEGLSQIQRIVHDACAHRTLRLSLTSIQFHTLVLGYSDDFARRSVSFDEMSGLFSGEKVLSKNLRENPLLLTLFLGYAFMDKSLRPARALKAQSERTAERWRAECRQVANRYLREAEERAQEILVMNDYLQGDKNDE